jgi:hypothetical protein
MTKRSFRRYAAAASVAVVVMTSCGDDDRETTSWAGASSVTAVTSATVGATEAGTSAPDVPTDGSASAATSAGEGTTSPVSGATSGGSSTGGDSTADAGTGASSTEAATTTTTGARPEGGPADRPGDGFETTTAGAEGCTQVDFLFVIDSSVSMEGEQAALTAAFPAFLATIADTLPTDDYQIMVVDTDAASRCSPAKCTHETCQAAGQHVCMDIFEACDTTLGAGVVHPAGEFTANKVCDFEPGQRYLAGSDPQLHASFKCAAEVGTAGDPKERPMDAMVAAVAAELQGPGGCNDGFLRDEAILVVTFISDDENVEDLNTAQQTHDALVAAKGGDADRIVMLGLIPGVGCGPGGLHWAQLIGLFGTHGIQGEVCSPDYNGFFQDAVTTILDACVINPG